MAYNPFTANTVASASAVNASIQEGIIRVADQAALTATLTNPIPPADGAWMFQTDIETIKQKNGSAFTDVLDVGRTRGLANPDLDFINSSGTAVGKIQVISDTNTTFSFTPGGASSFFSIHRINTAPPVTILDSGNLTVRSSDLDLTLQSSGTDKINLLAGTLNIGFGNVDTGIEIRGTAVPADRMLATNAQGKLAGLTIPTSYPSFMPTTIGTEGPGSDSSKWSSGIWHRSHHRRQWNSC